MTERAMPTHLDTAGEPAKLWQELNTQADDNGVVILKKVDADGMADNLALLEALDGCKVEASEKETTVTLDYATADDVAAEAEEETPVAAASKPTEFAAEDDEPRRRDRSESAPR